LEKIDHWTREAVGAAAQLVLFPELSLTGFIPNHPQHDHEGWLRAALVEARRMAISLDSQALESVRQIADRHRTLLSVGMLEDAGNMLFNTQILVGPQGILGVWRKMHVPMFEMPFYNGGDAAGVVDTPLGRIGVNICFDALLPESTRLLAIQNVEIVLFPFAADPPPRTPQGWAEWAGGPLRARTAENGVFGVACNYMGRVECAGVEQEFPGGGLILSPRGKVIAQWQLETGQSGLLIAELSAAELLVARSEPEYVYRFRRPELYGSLAAPQRFGLGEKNDPVL
jgi:N-carbamoylputrescine amidase